MAMEYYVVLGDDQVAGPFETRATAAREAAERTTNEVGLQYRVKAVPAGD